MACHMFVVIHHILHKVTAYGYIPMQQNLVYQRASSAIVIYTVFTRRFRVS